MEIKYKLPEEIDRSKIYYKITNENENHNGLQYRDGLIEDIVPFNDNPNLSCVEGGIYFTTIEHLPAFFDYGIWIRPLKIPEDARVILDPDGNKYRADKVFMLPRIPLNKYITDFFDKNTFLWDWYGKTLLIYFKDYFDLWWDQDKFNWRYNSWYLARYSPHHFIKWWNPEKFNWNFGSGFLAQYCSEYFDKWWNSNVFNWKECSWTLAQYCSNHFDKWWDKKKFNWKDKRYLIQYCSNHFDKWYDGRRFRKTEYKKLLNKYCYEYVN